MKKIVSTLILLALLSPAGLAQNDTTAASSPAKEKLKALEQASLGVVRRHKKSKDGSPAFFEVLPVHHFAVGFHSLSLSKSAADLDALPFATRSREIDLNIIDLQLNPVRWLSLSAGFDIEWDQYGFNDEERFFSTVEKGNLRAVSLKPNTTDYDYLKSFVKTTSLRFPMSLSFNFNDWTVSCGAAYSRVLDKYSRVNLSYKKDDLTLEETIHGITLNKNIWDFFGAVSYDGIGLYFKYSPYSIIPKGCDFEMSHYTVGFVLTM